MRHSLRFEVQDDRALISDVAFCGPQMGEKNPLVVGGGAARSLGVADVALLSPSNKEQEEHYCKDI